MSASNVQVLDRGLDLIERLATAENGMTISELVAETGLPKSTIHRILATFADRHYVEKNEETSVYSLGYKLASSQRSSSPCPETLSAAITLRV